ncbi:MAG: tyrosine decarboxylase MfnA [Euryarchaeota archaeon]|nr:tyrosine decarboxylase MfnA [Euryarchaeota archaeon]
MPSRAQGKSSVLAMLRALRTTDATYRSGRILGSMGTAPLPIAEAAHKIFLNANLGDPGHVPGAAQLEASYNRMLLDLAGAAAGKGVGQVTSGGSEANILALAWMRVRSGARDVIVPRTGHFSFEKAAKFLGLRLRIAETDEAHRVLPASVKGLIGPETAGIVAVAGTTQVGSVDPIAEIAELARDHDLPLHVDAAFGGYVLPFLRPRQPFGFDIPGVETVAMDTHKMAMGTIGAGALLMRDQRELDELAVETPYLSTPRQRGILGTRSAGPVAAAVAAWEELGRRGYERVVKECLANTARVVAALGKAGIRPLVPPSLNIVAVPHPDPLRLQGGLAAEGWRVNVLTRLRAIRLVLMPHVTRRILESFLPAFAAAHRATAEVPHVVASQA